MMKPELARQELGKHMSPKHLEARWQRIRKLPKATALLAHGLLGRNAENMVLSNYEEREKATQKAAETLAAKPKERLAVLQAFFPTLAEDLEAGWQVITRLPYTYGYDRRAFRAPQRPILYAVRQAEWFNTMLNALGNYSDDVLSTEWLAAWAIHLYGGDMLAYLFAGCIDRGGPKAETVFTILKDSAASRHEIGGMGAHVSRALLCCNRPDAWEFVEKLLLAAQRQEGLRQAILECVDEARPQAFQRMVALLLDENLLRFSSVARAVGVWLGEEESALNTRKLKADLQTIRDLLASEAKCRQALAKGDGATCFRALWAMAYADVDVAFQAALPLLKDKKPDRRFAAAVSIKNMALPETIPALLPLLEDPDYRLVAVPLDDLAMHSTIALAPEDTFDRLEKLLRRMPAKMPKQKPMGIGWYGDEIDRESVAALLPDYLGKNPAERLLPHLPMMDVYTRADAIGKLTEARTLSKEVRELVMGLAGEANVTLREAALAALQKCTITEPEAQQLEGYLTKKNAEFRRGVFQLLLNRSDTAVLGSVGRLLQTKDANQRMAGIELARQMVDHERQAKTLRTQLTTYRDGNKRLTKLEAESIEWVLNPESRPATLVDCLGLIRPDSLAPATPPRNLKTKFTTPAAVAFIKSLDDFIHEHRTKTFARKNYDDTLEEVVLGSASYYQLNSPNSRESVEKQVKEWQLADLWQGWWENRNRDTFDDDGCELLRVLAHPMVQVREGEENNDYWTDSYDSYGLDDDDDDAPKKTKAELAALKILRPNPVTIRYGGVMQVVLQWFLLLHAPKNGGDFLLDATETSLAIVPDEVKQRVPKEDGYWFNDWREDSLYTHWLKHTRAFRDQHDQHWKPAHAVRLYGLARWLDEASPGLGRQRPDESDFYAAYQAKAATVNDFIDLMVGARTAHRYWRNNFSIVSEISREPDKLKADYPELHEAAHKVLARILEVELARGEMPSEASDPALGFQALHGGATMFRLLKAFGKLPFAKQTYSGDARSKGAVLSHLIRVCLPTADDTPAAFAALAKEALAEGSVTAERLLELSCVNPKWVRHIEQAIGWPGLCEAVWWLTAHTNNSWSEEEADDDEAMPFDAPEGEGEAPAPKVKKKSEWGEIVAARTNLTAEQRAEGVVDVAWFHNAYNAVGNAKRWDAIETAAKFLGYGLSSKKAGRLADVLLGVTKKKDLVDGIRQKNLKEYVRLLGLLPLPSDAAKRESELLDRHKVLKDYERYARGLSSLSKEPALNAARIGLENLAVTAEYPDPLRLEWAVGAKTVTAMLQGAMSAKVKTIEVTLKLGEFGVPDLGQTKDGKPLKSLPSDVRKNAKVADLLEKRNELKRMAAGNKRSLELAMCQGDTFTAAEVSQLMGHPLVKPLIERLVLQAGDVRGYPTEDGKGLRDYKGKVRKIPANANVMIAHPLDLLAAGDWHDWQAECFRTERLQPFKQIFRELYTLTPQEKEDGALSARYAGQQINENQGFALFGARGWSTREGVEKLFRVANLVASVNFDHGYTTPGEVEGLTVGTIEFHQRGEWKRVKLSDVPVKIFSEVMRDLDLVVSVAHVGGVDPEASASTVEMRAMLLKEMQQLLKLHNVQFESKHALIKGEYGQYSVHLGSGVVHKQPGGSLCIVPVHSQHRGRVFLPFADDDPRTAEVVSKVLLLSRDKDIQDPTILEQIAKR